MARGSSTPQTPTASSSRPGIIAPRGSAPTVRRRRLGGGSSSSASSSSLGGGGNNNILRFYTDDSPGLKISPTVVLIMSVCFIAFVVGLHVVGKLYRTKSGS